ncbi:MAG: DUF4998 domain-containing protein [Tannerella sp.]|jgi:hypothetical protein|nr:DUF4998 domain-containing protein [Tannerella sp.]
MKYIKNMNMYMLAYIIVGLTTATSCIRIEHVEDVPYAAKIDDVLPHAGNRKVDLEIFISSVQIEMVRVYWDNRQRVKELSIDNPGTYIITIDGLEAMPYEFTLYSYDKFRRESLPVKTSVTVYDDAFLETLYGRVPKNAIYNFGNLRINWREPVPNEVKTVVTYTNKDGNTKTRDVLTTDEFTVIEDFGDYTQGFIFSSLLLPEATSLEFYETGKLLMTSIFNDLAKPGLMWDSCESLDGWTGDGLTLDGDDPREGSFCLMSVGGGTVRFEKVFPPFDTKLSKEKGCLALSFYIDDVASLGSGQLEITSGGKSDIQEIHWDASRIASMCHNGWNELELKLSENDQFDGTVNLSAINYFRLYNFVNKSAVFKIDRIRFYESEE